MSRYGAAHCGEAARQAAEAWRAKDQNRFRAASGRMLELIRDLDTLLALRRTVSEIVVSDAVEGYAVDLIRATREHADLRLGASPRTSVALFRASQAWAALDGRGFVLPDDVVAVVRPVLGHRLLLDVDRELRGATVERVLTEVLGSVSVPVPVPER